MSATSEQFPRETAGLSPSHTTEIIDLADGAEFDLRIEPVTKRIGDHEVRMLAYNGSIPGPTLRVRQGSEIIVHVHNEGDLEATVHWHGLRLDNRYDGTHETQDEIPVGGSYTARVSFPDPGLYWYHPHTREDYGQEMGLYGNVIVVPDDEHYWPPVHRELTLTLDDILIEDGRVAPFNRAETNYSAMGRFGNVLLVAGETDLRLSAKLGEVVRLYLTNTANTRVFKVRLPRARMKLVGGDSGRYEREDLVEDVVIAPSERIVVDAVFDEPGEVVLEHQTPTAPTPSRRSSSLRRSRHRRWCASSSRCAATRSSPPLRNTLGTALEAEPDKLLAFQSEMDMGDPGGEASPRTRARCTSR